MVYPPNRSERSIDSEKIKIASNFADLPGILRCFRETFPATHSSTRLQPLAALSEVRLIENPAVAATGSRHAIFPAVSPGRRVSKSARLLACFLRVNLDLVLTASCRRSLFLSERN